MQGQRVVDLATDVVGAEMIDQCIALVGVNDELVINMIIAVFFGGQDDAVLQIA